MIARIQVWIWRQVPKREELTGHRLIGPLARRQELWRFTRRSVPRGVAIGLMVGIFALIPGVQIVGAALLCVPFRGNIPLAAAMTFLTNPATTPFLMAAALFVGNGLGFHADMAAFRALYDSQASIADWVRWMLSDAAPALVLGLFVIAVVSGAVGYLASSFLWRDLVARRRKRRLARAAEPTDPTYGPAE
jgi:uncharacterized protein (DUF2062 family)